MKKEIIIIICVILLNNKLFCKENDEIKVKYNKLKESVVKNMIADKMDYKDLFLESIKKELEAEKISKKIVESEKKDSKQKYQEYASKYDEEYKKNFNRVKEMSVIEGVEENEDDVTRKYSEKMEELSREQDNSIENFGRNGRNEVNLPWLK